MEFVPISIGPTTTNLEQISIQFQTTIQFNFQLTNFNSIDQTRNSMAPMVSIQLDQLVSYSSQFNHQLPAAACNFSGFSINISKLFQLTVSDI